MRRDCEQTRGIAVELDDAPQSRLANAQTQEQTMHFNDVVDAFHRLPLNDRVILSLVVIEGMKYETAETTHFSREGGRRRGSRSLLDPLR